MKIGIYLSLILATCTSALNAQNVTVPDRILNDLQTRTIAIQENTKDTLVFKVVYPDNYDSTKTYPVMLGLSGGNQSEVIVNYCYAAWFKSNYFKDYLTILPVNNNKKNLLYYSQDDIKNMLVSIKNNFNATPENWIIVGTSNGGRATFNFISENPALFQGGILIPGSMDQSVEVDETWSHLRFVLAYGDKDSEDWIKGSENTKNTLSKYANRVETLVLKEQGHILPIDFDLDFVYKRYFEKN